MRKKYEASFGGLVACAVVFSVCAVIFLCQCLFGENSPAVTENQWVRLALGLIFTLMAIQSGRQAERAYCKKHGRPMKKPSVMDTLLSVGCALIWAAVGCGWFVRAYQGMVGTPWFDVVLGIACLATAGVLLYRGIRERRAAV